MHGRGAAGDAREQGQRLAIDPLWPGRATVGGILATNDSGMLRAGFGSLRDLIIGITVALPDGTLAKSGGKVVKNVAGYDLPKLFTGSFGTLGVITRATFRLHPLPHAVQLLEFTTPDAATPGEAARLAGGMRTAGSRCTGAHVGDRGQTADVRVRRRGPARSHREQGGAHRARRDRRGARAGSCHDGTAAARESLFQCAGTAAVCKLGVLPARVAGLYDPLRRSAGRAGFDWRSSSRSAGSACCGWTARTRRACRPRSEQRRDGRDRPGRDAASCFNARLP